MGHRRTVKSRPDRNPLPSQKGCRLLAVHSRTEGNGGCLVRAGEDFHPQILKTPDAAMQMPVLPFPDRFRAHPVKIGDSLCQSGIARYIQRSRFQPLR